MKYTDKTLDITDVNRLEQEEKKEKELEEIAIFKEEAIACLKDRKSLQIDEEKIKKIDEAITFIENFEGPKKTL